MPDEILTLEDSVRAQDRRERLEVGNEANVEYTEALRMLNLGSRSGLPYEVIEANPDAVEAAVNKDDFNKKDWMENSQEFADFAAENPLHLSVLKHDGESLGYFAREWKRPLSLSWNQTWAQRDLNVMENRRRKGRENWLPDDEVKMDALRAQIQDHDFGAAEGINPLISTVKLIGPMWHTIEASKEEAMVGGVAGAIVGGKIGAGGGTMLAPGPGTAFGTGAGVLTGWGIGLTVGATVGGAEGSFEMMAGEQYGRFIQAGFTHEEAARVSTITGAVSTLPEMTGVWRLVKHMPGISQATGWTAEQIAKKMAVDVLTKPTVRQATARLAMNYGGNMSIEIGTEVFQDSMATVGQNYLAATRDKPDAKVSYDQWVDDMSDTIVHTARGMSILAGMSPGSAYVANLRRAQRSKQAEQAFLALADNINKSETRREAPETYAKFVEAVTEAKGGVWVGANQWDTFWQERNQDPNEMAERFGIDLETLDDARIPDHNIEIPALAFAEQLAPSDMFSEILPDLKWHEEDMSPRERKLFEANKPQIIRDIEASIDELNDAESEVQVDKIMQDVGGQLIAAQMDPTTSGHLAQLYRGFGVIADKLDMDPQELFEKFFGGVRRTTAEALTRSEVLDPNIDPIINRLRRQDWPTQKETMGASLMDLIDEAGGLDPADPELSAMDFDLGALDLGISKAKMKRWQESGRLVSEIAELAQEAGYIAENSESVLLEAISREIGGEPVFGTRDEGDPAMRDMEAQMGQVERMIAELELDINEMSNAELRAILEAADQYDQDLSGEELRSVFTQMAQAEEKSAADAAEIDNVLAKASNLFPLIYQEQNFGDLQLTDTVQIEGTDEVVQITEDAQVKFDAAVKRKKAMNALLKCVSG